ncbi:MAG: hypothetical protein HEP71_24455 [Roseivirga sp.]|nr:hypothetical protein [Roseivirga sp.]
MSKTDHLKSTYYDSSLKNLESLINYLESIGGKPLTSICRRQNAFKTSWTQKDLKLITRCHIQNAAEYLGHIKTDCSANQIKVTIADVAYYVKSLDSNEDLAFILLSTNTLPSAIHFDSAKRLFFTHQIRKQNQNNYATDLLTLYSIRLSLESRVRGLLGIDFATSNSKVIGLSTLIKVAKGLQAVEYTNSFDWTEIEWVNHWLNHHMHRHIRPYPWVIFQALESLKPFVDPKEPIVKEGRAIHSFYSAAYVDNEEEFEKEIQSALETEFPEIEIKWLSKREIVKKK